MENNENSSCVHDSNLDIEDDMKLCGDVRKFRDKKDWTQDEFAAYVDLPLSTIQKIESKQRAKRPLSTYFLMKWKERK